MGIKAAKTAVKKLRFEVDKKINGEWRWVKEPIKWIEDEQGRLKVTDENGGPIVIDYYDFYQATGGIHPDLIKAAEDNGCYWEWEHPGAICLAN